MRIDIQGRGFALTAALLGHANGRLRLALAPSQDRIKRVVVRLGDVNGPRGGEDKFCKIQVVLDGAPHVLIEDAGADLYAVIDRAADRAGRNAVKHVARLREGARPGRRKSLDVSSGDDVDVSNN